MKLTYIVIYLLLIKYFNCCHLLVNFETELNVLNHFWKSTGQCPPAPKENASNYLLSNDNKINIALISALPVKSIQYIRIHWLLELIKIRNIKERDALFTSKIIYDFTNLDELVQWNYQHGLYLIFELMGNPNKMFDNFENKTQVRVYKKLIKKIIGRYKEMYGLDYLNSWLFETWNEPDLKGYNILNFTLPAFINYVRASKAAVNNSKFQFKLGGPAGLFKNKKQHPLCWGIIDYCCKTKCPFDFFTFHAKGNESSQGVIDRELEIFNSLETECLDIKNVSFVNDEADPLKNWAESKEWRADVRYAAMIVKTIIYHQKQFNDKKRFNIKLISNDNAFLSYHPYYFTQRTLLARFQINTTNPPHVQFIQKPVYVAMGLLSYLGNVELATNEINNCSTQVTALAGVNKTRNNFSLGIILLYANDTTTNMNLKNILVTIKQMPSYKNMKYVVYSMDNIKNNPYEVWKSFGAPFFPNKTVLNAMRNAEGPNLNGGVFDLLPNKDFNIFLNMSLPSLILIYMCGGSFNVPGPVSALQVFNVTFDNVLLIWSDKNVHSRCIKTYEIEFSPSLKPNESKVFTRINHKNVLFLSFYYSPKELNHGYGLSSEEKTVGQYRVRAVDFWGRVGPFSETVNLINTY